MSLFNKPKRKIQSRRKLEEEPEEEGDTSRIEDIRELQRSRERKNGLTEIECAVGKEKAAALEDGLEMAGGKMAMTGKQRAKLEAAGIEAGIREQFEKETLLRDEHDELQKFIDEGLKKESGEPTEGTSALPREGVRENDVLMRAARKLQDYRSEGATELLSEHMLAGIPEVDLGISARISNILETEKKKKELLERAVSGKSAEVLSTDETEFFSQHQIDEIRECFNVYSPDGLIRSAPQLRCILRSLGYTPTAAKTAEYFKSKKRAIDFASFLEIAKEEQSCGDALTEVIKALKGLDRTGSRAIPVQELRSVLSSIGERMSHQEIDFFLDQVAVGGIVPHQKLIQFISKP